MIKIIDGKPFISQEDTNKILFLWTELTSEELSLLAAPILFKGIANAYQKQFSERLE